MNWVLFSDINHLLDITDCNLFEPFDLIMIIAVIIILLFKTDRTTFDGYFNARLITTSVIVMKD